MAGDDVDPRYSLANERTFLAWVRTSLAFLAAAAGLTAVDLPWPTQATRALAVLLCLAAAVSASSAWRRWQAVETAIAEGRAAPLPRAHRIIPVILVVVAGAVIVLVLV